MKDSLLSIYRAVAEGRLAQAEALVRIKALKRQMSDAAQGVLLATPEWIAASAASVPAQPVDRQPVNRIFVWGVDPAVAASLKATHGDARIEAFAPPANVTAADGIFTDAALQGLAAIQSMLAGAQGVRALVIVADTAAVDEEAADEAVACGFDAMFRTAMEETPALVARVIRVPADIGAAELQQLVHDESCADAPRGAAVRHVRDTDGLRREILRWRVLGQDLEGHVQTAAPVAFKEGGCYLITGGAGGIGLQFAREIVAQCRSARIVLAGRSTLTPEARRTLDALATPLHQIEYVALDVADRSAVDALVAQLREQDQPLRGILHCAGILRDGFILRKSPSTFASVLAPKVAGLANLDLATRDLPLDFILLCSSFAACWGIVGQVDYAAANAFMDAFAAHRNRLAARGERHGRTLSVNWPLWQDGGMGMDAATRDRLLDHTGMRPLSTVAAMRAMYRGLALPCERLLVMEGELPAMRALLEAADSATGSAAETACETACDSATARVVDATPVGMDDALREKALEFLCRQFSQVLKIPAARLRPQAPLEQYGIDSILAMKLVTHLETIFGRLPKTLAFEYQTIAQLNEYFCTAHADRLISLLSPSVAPPNPATGPSATTLPTTAAATTSARSRVPGKRIGTAPRTSDAIQSQSHVEAQPIGFAPRSDAHMRGVDAAVAMARNDKPPIADEPVLSPFHHSESIAIVGISGRYPEAWDLDEYWRNLSQGVDCIREIPADRWRWQDYYRDVASGEALAAGQHSSKWGGFIQGADEFDPRFFSITPRDAEQIDPQERMFLQHAWMAIEDAGYTRAALQAYRGGQVGVYAGVMYGEYNRSGSLASIANRLSYVLNLHGPSMTLDTMCSSSLTAIHLASQDLRLGRTDMALAGGVNLSLHPGKYGMLSAGQFISSDGHCQSFGEGGDGYIPGEGVGVVVLKRLSDAQRDGDAIHAVIRGSALNHGGKTNGYTVPNPQAQAAVIADALKDAGVDARHVSYIEAHGTGTKLGDPIEIAALGKAFREHTPDTGFCLIGSAKSNIGHCESAAGIAGLTKVILQMRHRQIVPSLHSERLNPNIDFETTPFEVNQQLRDWEAPVIDGRQVPLIAGVSSFGAGGGNAHLVVEAYPVEAYSGGHARAPHHEATPCVVLLSARTLPQLRQKAQDLRAFVERDLDIDLLGLSYTLQIGREAMEERLAMRVDSRAEMIDKLAAFLASDSLDDGALMDDLYYAQSRRHRDTIALFTVDKDLQASIDSWFVAGKVSRLLDVWTKGLDLDWLKLHSAPLPGRMHLPVYPFARERYWRDEPADMIGTMAPAAHAMHSLVHRNVSKPGHQHYLSTFRADDARIKGLRIHGYAHLPHGLLLEAARAALADGWDAPAKSAVWALRDVRFAAPRTLPPLIDVGIAVLLPGQGLRSGLHDAAFEIATTAGDGHVFCQGFVEACPDAFTPTLDIAALSRGMSTLFADQAAILDAGRAIGLDVDALYQVASAIHRTADGLWLTCAPSDPAHSAFADCVIDPAIVEAAILAAQWLRPAHDALHLPVGFAGMRVYPARGQPRYAWIRTNDTLRQDDALCVDIALCAADGAVCIAFTALTLMPAVVTTAPRIERDAPQAAVVHPIAHDARQTTPVVRMPDRLFRSGVAVPVRIGAVSASLAKPTAIALASPGQAAVETHAVTLDKPALSLATHSDVDVDVDVDGHEIAISASVVLRDRGDGIFALRLQSSAGSLDAALIDALQQALAHARGLPSLKALLIESDERIFLQGGHATLDDDDTRSLLQTLASFHAPTLAVLTGQALGAGFRLACACDAVIAVEDQNYGFATPEDGPVLVDAAQIDWLAARFGEPLASLLATSAHPLSGRELQAAGWGALVVPREGVAAAVDAFCANLSDKPANALRLLKQHLAREFDTGFAAATASSAASDALLQSLQDLTGSGSAAATTDHPADIAVEAGALTLASTVVHASVDADGVVLVRLEDRDARNMFSDALIAGLQEVFDHIGASSAYKAVVLTGYDTYFSSGGTRDGLKAIQEGRVRFTDLDVFQLPMRCPLPVIAAMQGHGIGAGWTLGLFCDSVLFSEESRYVSPYMNFGFTPGAGATGILPARLGFDLARDSLFTGREITGAELARRNPLLTVLPRDRVLDEALALARSVARHARADLVAWKAARVSPHIDAWQALFAREVAMHEATLVGHADALSRIERRFALAQQPTVDTAPRRASAASAGTDILPTIRRLLAEELRVDDTEIDARTPFVDVGLDSISSVTWIRRINAHFGLAIEATKVYSYPNLHKLAQHVGEQLSSDTATTEAMPAEAVAVRAVVLPPAIVKESSTPRREVAVSALATPVRAHVDLGAVRRTLIDLLAQELRQAPESIDADRSFVELGLDSISGVTWVRAINQHYGTAIEATRVYTYPTVEHFTRFVRDTLTQHAAAGAPAPPILVPPAAEPAGVSSVPHAFAFAGAPAMVLFDWPVLKSWRSYGDVAGVAPAPEAVKSFGMHATEIAVIGMAGRFPMAKDVDSFWDNIANGRNCISEIPSSRWDTSRYYVEDQPGLGQSNSKWMGVLEGHDRFDPLFFGLSPVEAEAMDPQQRIFLQSCWHGMENAGYTAERLSGSKCGVFVGCAHGDYNLLSREQQINALGFTGGATSILAARVSYFMNLQGPCVSIDTACSSSLVAIATACDSLITGASDIALAGGVYVMANADMFLKTAHAGMLSPDGRCYTFDQRANGFVPGEGVGVVMLKRLADAERDGDRILGVVRGWGTNQDGRTNGITAPNAESQQRLIQDVYDRFNIDPDRIGLIEAHGTGTKLGDPIEIDGLKSAFLMATERKQYCAIGSVKTNIGHCLTAAGVSGFIKLLLALQHRKLPPSINFETPNEHLDLHDSPFFVNTTTRDWASPEGTARHAAISSFGFSGTNAHLVLAEYVPHATLPVTAAVASPMPSEAGFVVPLSARTAERLLQKAMDLRDFVRAASELDLAALACSLQIHRDAMDERLSFVAHDARDVVDMLTAYIDGAGSSKSLPHGVFAAHVRQGRESVRLLSEDAAMATLVVDKCIADGNASKLCELWVKGLALDWRRLHDLRKPVMIALPPYPFSEDAYWIVPSETSYATMPSGSSDKPRHLHPLLQEKVADIREQGYRQTTVEHGAGADVAKQIELIHLPTYAFARMRCWIPSKEDVRASSGPAMGAPPLQPGRFVQNLDAIAGLFAELEEDTLSAAEVTARVRQLA